MAKSPPKICPIYVVAGPDIFLRTQALAGLRAELLGKDQELGEVRIEGKSADLISVLDELRTLPFLADRRVAMVEDADKFISENREALEEYLKHPSPTGVLVLIVDSWRKNTRLAKQVDQIGRLIPAESLKAYQLPPWVVGQVRQQGKEISMPAARELVAMVGTETGRLNNEVEKLVLYVGSRKQITVEDVAALSGQTSEESAFVLTDLMAEGKARDVVERLNRLLEMDRSAEYTLAGALTYSLRRLLKAKTLLEGGVSRQEVLSACKIYPGIADKFMGQLRRFSAERLRRLLDQLAKVDYANKTGLGQARMNLEKFILCATTNG